MTTLKPGSDKFGSIPQPFKGGTDEVHRASDVDASVNSLHHTLGVNEGQSSPGPHIHDGRGSRLIPQSSIIDLEARLSALERTVNGQYVFVDFSPDRVITSNGLTNIPELAMTFDNSLPFAPGITHVLIHGEFFVTYDTHVDFRYGCTINGVAAAFNNFRIIGALTTNDGVPNSMLTYCVWDRAISGIPASPVTIAFSAGFTAVGRQATIGAAKVWTSMV